MPITLSNDGAEEHPLTRRLATLGQDTVHQHSPAKGRTGGRPLVGRPYFPSRHSVAGTSCGAVGVSDAGWRPEGRSRDSGGCGRFVVALVDD